MSYDYNQLVNAAIIRAYSLIDYNIYDDIHEQHEFCKKTVLEDDSLTENEKFEAMKILIKAYDDEKIVFNTGIKRICENCNKECLATTYCELCVRNYLKTKFSNWTSGNYDIDNLIQECQMKTFIPDRITEWIPYNNLQNIEYLTKGGFSEIYTAKWIDGNFIEWDSEEQQLIRYGTHNVVLKRLENVENSNQSWIEEAKSHLLISNKWNEIVRCFGLTQDPSDGNYMLVMNKLDMDLRKYLQQNHKQLLWKKRIQIITNMIVALYRIHDENAIHRDLHSGNVLFAQRSQNFEISDLGFCGPADKPLKSIYGNLPYLAPEVIIGKGHTFKSDIYGIAMLMWEISSGQPPFFNYEHNYDLAMNIVSGIRPKIVLGTPLEYENLMKQCWDADPSKRPDIHTLWDKMSEINLFYQSQFNDQLEENNNLEWECPENYTSNSSSLFASKLYQFDNLPEPRNATEEELEAFYCKSYDFYIPDKIDNFGKSSSQKNESILVNKDGSKNVSKVFNELPISSEPGK
ncbi:polo kinase CDC5 [Rhizophagus irregularis DAOM 197198w]|uniref:Polo kinase CDC5 n=1 Tax=Rhizophagus irregularis (strain DAOM 197198w) TaxID=1432141 RepID=A0A015K484_RHIIW|nr:polo kinase CDC5 [Rhizophagus irregularis DAOM 197198w]